MRKEFALIMIVCALGASSAYGDSQINITQSAGQTVSPIIVSNGTNNVLFQVLAGGQVIINEFIQFSGSGLTALRTYVFPDSDGTIVLEDFSQTLSQKSIDADTNTISNIDDNEIKSNAGIDVTKLSSGIVDNTELNYLNGTTSNIQTQLNSKVNDGTNVGSGTGLVFKDKLGNDLRLKTIKAGNRISVTNNVDDITIDTSSVGIPTMVKLGSDVSTSSTACCVDATGLSFSISSGKLYHFKFLVRWDSTNVNRGIGLTLNGPTTTFLNYDVIYPTTRTAGVIHNNNAYNLDITTGTTPGIGASPITSLAIVEGLIQPSADGTLIVRFQADNAAAPVTIRANSIGFLTEIP